MNITTTIAAVAIAAALSTSAFAGSMLTTCQSVRGSGYSGQVCETTVTHDPEPAPVEPSIQRGPGTVELVRFDAIDEARKAKIVKRDPHPVDMCPAPWHMTARDGCQR